MSKSQNHKKAKKRVLITGASGFIGKMLVNILTDADYEIIPFVRKAAGLKNETVIDYCDADFPKVINSLPKVDVVVHLGAKIGCDDSSREVFFRPNVLATAELANWANKVDAYFVFASTAIVCGVKNPLITPESNPNPDTNYGYSKWLAEEIIKISGVKHAILRISGVFGKDGSSHLGINKAITDALNGIVPIQYGNGKIKRNYIYVKDLANIFKFCIDNEIKGIHLVSGASINTISEMLQIICNCILPDRNPECRTGQCGNDQIVERSSALPRGIHFEDTLRDILINAKRSPV